MKANPIRSAVLRGLPVLFCGALASSPLFAQREAVKPAAKAEKAAVTNGGATQPGQVHEAIPAGVVEIRGDEPDFRPYEEVPAAEGSGKEPVLRPSGDPYVLAFPGGSFKPEPGVDARLRTMKGEVAYGYVMVEGQMNASGRRQRLEALGCKILGVHTWQSWVVQFPRANADAIANLDFVRWVGMAQIEQKLEPQLAAQLAAAGAGDFVQVDISTFVSDVGPATERVRGARPEKAQQPNAPVEEAIEELIPNGAFQVALEGAGMRFESYTDIDNVHIFHGKIRKADLAKILELPFVAYVEQRPEHRLSDDSSMSMIQQDLVRRTYTGRGVPIGIIDTGVYSQSVRHRDLTAFMVGWSNVTGESSFLDGHGHGTHVAGTMIGRGIADRRYKGAAPGVATDGTDRLFNGRYFNSSGAAQGNVSTLYNALRQTYTSGSQTSPRPYAINNSWGSYRTAGYNGADSGSRTVDAYVWSYRQAYVFAAGNEGSTAKVRSPGTAKNVITVGGTDDTSASGRPGGFYSASSGGGTVDNRNKPELLAPGTRVTSLQRASSTAYTNKSGTSMAAPHITGAIASLVHYNKPVFGYFPERIKAHLLASTEYLGSPGSSSGWFGVRGGYGQLDARKMIAGSKSSWHHVGGVSSSTNGALWRTDITIPTATENLKFIGTWHEPASSSAATQARVNDVRFLFDVEPFNSVSSPGTGDIMMSSSHETVLSMARGGSAARALRGKKVRVWMWGRTVTSTIRPSWSIVYDFDIPSSSATLSLSAPTIVKPSASFTATATLDTPTNVADFDSAHLRLAASGFSFLSMRRTALDGTLHSYTGTSFPSYPYPSLTNGMTVGTGDRRDLQWTLRAPATSGTRTLTAYSNSYPGSQRTTSRSICVDGLAPQAVANLRSLSHTVNRWSRVSTLRMAWNAASDNGCAGMAGYATRLGAGSKLTPTSRNLGNVTTQNVTLASSSSPYYFGIRGVDRISNFGTAVFAGPYYFDNVRPTLSSVSINNGASYTTSRNVNVKVTASDAHSGVSQVRFSANGSAWSSWVVLSASGHTVDLAANGGNTSQGTKQIYAQVADRAGNVSSSVRDLIVYDSVAPVVTSVVIRSGATATTALTNNVNVAGSGAPTQMRFSSDNATWSSWRPYSTAAFAYDLSSFGGNTAFGTKSCWCQMRDAAGNTSSSRRDTILYVGVPVLNSLSRSSIGVVNKSVVRLSGTNLGATNRVLFGSTSITSTRVDDWARGYIRVVDNNTVDLYIPQGQAPGSYAIRVSNPAATSGARNLSVVHNSTSFAGSPVQTKLGDNLDVKIHRGNHSPTSVSILLMSASGQPLNIPGLVNLGHGGNSTTLIDPSLLVLAVGAFDATTRTASYAVPTNPSLPKIKLYFESLNLDTLNPNARPIPSSGATSTQLY